MQRRIDVDPFLLRTFLVVKARLSFTRAAEDLLLSQPTISRQILRLEQELGVPLFEKLGKKLFLTEAGRTLAREAERLLGDLERAAESVRAHGGEDRGALRVGASTTPGYYLLPRLLGRFHAKHPQVDLTYQVDNSHRIEQAILGNELDVGFVGARVGHEEVEYEPLLEDEVVIFAGARHPLSRERKIPVRRIGEESWVIREKGSATRRIVEEQLSRSGVKFGKAITLGCPEAAKALVAEGLGLSFLSIHGLRRAGGGSRFKVLDVSGFPLRRTIYSVRHASKRMAPPVRSFLELARAVFSEKPGS